jgi:hypothetical protein
VPGFVAVTRAHIHPQICPSLRKRVTTAVIQAAGNIYNDAGSDNRAYNNNHAVSPEFHNPQPAQNPQSPLLAPNPPLSNNQQETDLRPILDVFINRILAKPTLITSPILSSRQILPTWLKSRNAAASVPAR